MPVDLSEFEAFIKTGCPVARLDLTPEQRKKLDAALERHDISGTAIVAVLTAWGKTAVDTSINKHRRKACLCYKHA